MELRTYNEITDVSLPIRVCNDLSSIKSNVSMFKFVFIEKGTGIININGTQKLFSAPVIYCLNDLEEMVFEVNHKVELNVIYFDTSLVNNILQMDKIRDIKEFENITNFQDYIYIEPFLNREDKFKGKYDLDIAASTKLHQLIESLNSELLKKDNKYWPCRTRSFFLQILFFLQCFSTENEVHNGEIELPEFEENIRDIILFLHTNYERKITIAEISRAFNTNRTTISKKIKVGLGCSIKEYLIKVRINAAAMLLRDTNLPVTEIMYRVGFNNITHFGRMFKRLMGCSPTEYKKSA